MSLENAIVLLNTLDEDYKEAASVLLQAYKDALNDADYYYVKYCQAIQGKQKNAQLF